jgi:hypothetical protein
VTVLVFRLTDLGSPPVTVFGAEAYPSTFSLAFRLHKPSPDKSGILGGVQRMDIKTICTSLWALAVAWGATAAADTIYASSERELRDLGRNARTHLSEAIEIGAAGQLQDIYNLEIRYENPDIQPVTKKIFGKSFFWEKQGFHPPEDSSTGLTLPQEFPVAIANKMALYYNTEGSARTLRRLLKLMRKDEGFPGMLNLTDPEGRTLLFQAVESCKAAGRLKTVMVLLEFDPDQTRKDSHGRTVADLLWDRANDGCVDQLAIRQLFGKKEPLGAKLMEFNAQLMNALDAAEDDQFAIARGASVSIGHNE